MVRFGCSYHPAFFTPEEETKLQIPPFVSYVELGISEFKQMRSNLGDLNVDLSLHLSRTPVTEDSLAQDRFIEYICSEIDSFSFRSIGIHITGSRYEDIGVLGFSSYYHPTEQNENRASSFIRKLSEKSNLPVWIENANYYSRSPEDIFKAWQSMRKICERTDARLIVDLSHIFVDASNVNVLPVMALGMVPWEYVSEIHLSGVVRGADGIWHDGHAVPVHEDVWALLEHSMKTFLNDQGEIVLTIEHTDADWAYHKEAFNNDFSRLHDLVSHVGGNGRKSRFLESYSEHSAVNYLKKIFNRQIPKLKPACEQRNISFDDLVKEWIRVVTVEKGRRIVFSEDEIPPQERSKVSVAIPDFLKFAKERLASCG